MKKRLKYIFILILLILVSGYHPALAGTVENVTANADKSGKVTISGNISSGQGKIVNVTVTMNESYVVYADSAFSGKNGEYSFTFQLPSNAYGYFDVTVNTADGSTPARTTFSYGTENSLSSLKVNTGTMTPEFSPDITEYMVTVDNNKSRIKFLPEVNEKAANITINGETVKDGVLSKSFLLDREENGFTIKVTAMSGDIRSYTVTVIRKDAGIPELTAKAAADPDKNVEISGTISTGSGKPITVLVKNPKGKVDFAGVTYSNSGGFYSLSYVLADETTGKYTVEAGTLKLKEKVETCFYYIKDVYLESLMISDVKLSPDFRSDVTKYTAETDGSFDTVTLTPVACDGTEEITVNKQTVKSGEATGPIRLNMGKNVIKITLKALGGKLKKTYTITVQKGYKAPELFLEAGINREKRVKINGNIGLKSKRTVSVMVTGPKGNVDYTNSVKTAQDGSFKISYLMTSKDKGTYTVTAGTTDLATPAITTFVYEPNTNLASLGVSEGSLAPAFDKDQLSYSVNVGSNVREATISATAEYTEAEVKIADGAAMKGSNTYTVPLYAQCNSIPITVSLDDDVKTYYVTIYVEDERKSSVAALSGITIKNDIYDVELDPAFNPEVTEYYALIYDEMPYVTVTPTAADRKAAITVNGMAVASGKPTDPINLDLGENEIIINVTAEDGTLQVYRIYVEVRSYSSILSNIILSAGGREIGYTPAFDPYFSFEYRADSVETTSITVIPAVSDGNPIITVNGMYTEGNTPQEIELDMGDNCIEIQVTAEDGDTCTYYIYVTRQLSEKSSDASLSNITLSPGGLETPFESETMEYSAEVSYDTAEVAVVAEASNNMARITVGDIVINSGETFYVGLNVGENIIEITVTAEDGEHTCTYYVYVTRQEPESSDDFSDKSSDVTAGESTDKTSEEPSNEPADESSDKYSGESSYEPTEKSTDETSEEFTDDSEGKPI